MKSSSVLGKARKPNNKDKDKRKPQLLGESSSTDKSPSKESGAGKYAGISSESIACMAEQVLAEHLSEDVCNNLAEDISFKLRQVIHNACLNMKMGKRETLTVSDVDGALKHLNVEKIYGPANPSWIPFGDQQLSYIEDTIVQLQELAVKESVFYQPTCPAVERNWIMSKPAAGAPEIPKAFVNYYIKCSQAIISPNLELRQTALKDIETNHKIGPIIIWFYNFVFLLLRKAMTCDGLMNRALSLLEAIESNPVSKLVSYDQQLKLITMQLFELMFLPVSYTDVRMENISKMLQLSCIHWTDGREMILEKILSYLDDNYAHIIVTILNALGSRSLDTKLWPNISSFLPFLESDSSNGSKLQLALYESCNIYYQNNCNVQIDKLLYDTFGEVVVPLRRIERSSAGESALPESNWLNVKVKLFKTQRKIDASFGASNKKLSRDEVFQCYCNTSVQNKKIKIKLHSYAARCQLCKRNINTITNGVSLLSYTHSRNVVVGKTSLLLNINDFKVTNSSDKHKKYDLLYYNL